MKSDMPGMSWRDFEWRVFGWAWLGTILLMLVVVLVPQWLSREARLQVLRDRVAEVAKLAASVVDGDAHRQLIDKNNYSQALYDQALTPLMHLHSADASIYYAYTMVEQGGDAYFILDTAQSRQLKTTRTLEASGYYEHFQLRPEYAGDWLKRIAAGETWVTPAFQRDKYGAFLSGHSPIYDSQGRYSGFVGVDFDTGFYHAQERRFDQIAMWTVLAVLLLGAAVAHGVARYHYQWQYRLALHYHSSMRDDLTQLLNRRGAYEAVEMLRRVRGRCNAVLLIDIDDFKRINDTQGHAMGDAVLVSTARVIRDSVRNADVVARLGGDEFLVFAPDCDEAAAREIAARIQERVAEQQDVACAYSLSVGISIATQELVEFDVLYRRADDAMYRAKKAGKNRFEVVNG